MRLEQSGDGTSVACRLCGSARTVEYCRDAARPYFRCGECALIFVPEEYQVTPEEEKVRYGKHTNDKGDKKYEAYLSAIARDVLDLPVASPRIVDFGSGPHHVLSDILNTREARCVPHDPLYGLDAAGSPEQFDIAVLCETIEHVRNLPAEINLLSRLVRPEGFVYIHTQLYDHAGDFLAWWYIKDVTHINFFCEETMTVAAGIMGKRVVRTNGKDTVVLQ
jgi:hypothetical protein